MRTHHMTAIRFVSLREKVHPLYFFNRFRAVAGNHQAVSMGSLLRFLFRVRKALAKAIPPIRYPGYGKVAVVMTRKSWMLADDFCEDG